MVLIRCNLVTLLLTFFVITQVQADDCFKPLRRSFWCLTISHNESTEGEYAFIDLKVVHDIRLFVVGDAEHSKNRYTDQHLTMESSIDGNSWDTMIWELNRNDFYHGNQTLKLTPPKQMRYIKILLESGLYYGDYKCIQVHPFGCRSKQVIPEKKHTAVMNEVHDKIKEDHVTWNRNHILIISLTILILLIGMAILLHLRVSTKRRLDVMQREIALIANGKLNKLSSLRNSDGLRIESHDSVVLLESEES